MNFIVPQCHTEAIRKQTLYTLLATMELMKLLAAGNQGDFCKLISLEASSRICLTMQDAKLQKSGFEPLQQMSEHVRGISLATVLAYCHLTARMKVALAYILAPSIWQY